ncbi:MAG TPA: pantetheine-phosphate adenylyltransferase [Acidiferrobacteraceae bacterium]|nr:pantetheine-phosphate adenylyltransferase [Acidiferrobacteraceae bacterium]
MPIIALYPGTFDPLTNGHSDLVARACRLFDEVVVAVAANPDKRPLFTLDERLELARAALAGLPRVRIMGFDRLLVDCARACHAQVILRGLRAVSDFEYEFQMAGMNRRLDADIQTLFLPASDRDAYISSSLVKELAKLGGDVTPFVDIHVKDALRRRFQLK